MFIVGLMWFCVVMLASWQEYNELQDPTYNYRLDAGNFLVSYNIIMHIKDYN